MTEPCGAIFGLKPGAPPLPQVSNKATLVASGVLMAINGSSVVNSTDFAKIISMTAPGATVYLNTMRSVETISIKLRSGSARCGRNA